MTKKFDSFTRPKMKALNPGEEIRENSIRYTKLPDGDGRFSVDIKVNKQRIHRVVGLESEGVTRKHAEEFIEKTRTEARENRLKLPKGRKTELLFSEAVTEYLKRLKEGDGKDIPKKEERLKLHLLPFFGKKPLAELTSFDIEKYKKYRKDENAKPATINRELAVVTHLINCCIDWGFLQYAPCKVKHLKEDNARMDYLTTEECNRLLLVAKNDITPQIYMFILIGLETGMRSGEIPAIRLKEINTNQKTLYIPKAKAGKRVQPITERLSDFLEEHLKYVPLEQEWLFPSIGKLKTKVGHTTAIEEPFRRVVAAVGLNPSVITPHILRHTTTTHLVQAGIDIPTIQAITGHKTPIMVHRYAHQNGLHIQEAMKKLQNRYQEGSSVISTKGRRIAAEIS